MSTKEHNSQSKYTIQFNQEKQKQSFAIKCLSDKGRKKAAYIAEAIWMYERYLKNELIESDGDSQALNPVACIPVSEPRFEGTPISTKVQTEKTQVFSEESPLIEPVELDKVSDTHTLPNQDSFSDDIVKLDDADFHDEDLSPSAPVELDVLSAEEESNQDLIKGNLKAWGLNY